MSQQTDVGAIAQLVTALIRLKDPTPQIPKHEGLDAVFARHLPSPGFLGMMQWMGFRVASGILWGIGFKFALKAAWMQVAIGGALALLAAICAHLLLLAILRDGAHRWLVGVQAITLAIGFVVGTHL